MTNNTPLDTLSKYWGYERFRAPQEEIIQSALLGIDSLALLPTGGGKSICFQVPGLCQGGLTLVISPLVALMKDQVSRLNEKGIAATYINSSLAFHEIDRKLDLACEGTYRFLYLAPERIQNEVFQARLRRMPVQLLAVDEAHCISQWGYDFRPAYLEIHKIREVFPHIPIMALTASATVKVQKDIVEKLKLQSPEIFKKSFKRANLRYFVLKEENVTEKILEICTRVQGSGIVYARTRKRTEGLAKLLESKGLSAGFYHGGMSYSQRDEAQGKWIQQGFRIMVATNAFGMGIDKGDVRFVIHANLPTDIESYYQEAGRGGRDGQTALAIAFNNPIDLQEVKRWSEEKYPPWEQVQTHFEGICSYLKMHPSDKVSPVIEIDVAEVAHTLEIRPLKLYRSLQILNQEGVVNFQEGKDDFAYLQVTATPQTVLQYKAEHPDTERLIDYLLRTLGGTIYTQEQRFLPRSWARRLNMEEEELLHKLNRLHQHFLISYIPPKGMPSIQVLGPMRTLRKEEVNWDKYRFLRKQVMARFQEMESYIHQTDLCRSLFIQQYFGEKDHQPCGKCDVCIGRNKTQVSDKEFNRIQTALVRYLHRYPGTLYKEILHAVQAGSPAQKEKVLRYLLDKQVIQIAENGSLFLPK